LNQNIQWEDWKTKEITQKVLLKSTRRESLISNINYKISKKGKEESPREI
jgi:hypothetical protein